MPGTVVGADITAVIKTLSLQRLQANKQVTTVQRNNRIHIQGALGEHKMDTQPRAKKSEYVAKRR